MNAEQFRQDFPKVNDFYAAPEGLQRPGGMVIDRDGVPTCDIEAMTQWGVQLAAGTPLSSVLHQICQSDEWKTKHPGEPFPFELLPARVEQGRYRTDAGWFVPRFYVALDAVWLVQNGQRSEWLRRLDRARAARCNGVQFAGMLDWRHPDGAPYIAFSPFDSGYWEALHTVVQDAAEREMYGCVLFFCDAQRIVPEHLRRIVLVEQAAVFCQGNPTLWMVMANEARKNGWNEADDDALLALADLFKNWCPATILAVSDPLDGDTTNATAQYLERQNRIAPHADELIVHASRKEDSGVVRRWLNHLKALADDRERWPGKAVRHAEPMGAASTRQLTRRDNSVVAHVAGAVIGAMCGGYTFMHRSDEDDACPGLLESAFAADIPGSPDFRFVNAGLAGSAVESFSGWDKIRGTTNGQEQWICAYGFADKPGSIVYRPGWTSSTVLDLADGEGRVQVVRLTR